MGNLYSIQELSSGKVSVMARPRGGDWLLDEMKALHRSGVDVLVSLLTASEEHELDLTEEAASCRSQGIVYYSYPILDLGVPTFSEQTFLLLQELDALRAEGKHIALHCRQGLGRSVTMAACLLVLAGFAPEQTFEMLSKVRGYAVPETEEQRTWVVAFSRLQGRSDVTGAQ